MTDRGHAQLPTYFSLLLALYELAAAERESGRLAERQRLARDLHDTLAQGFVSIVLQLQAAEGELPPARTWPAATWSGPGARLHIFAKLGVDDRTAAVVSALERGIIALSRRKA